MYNVFLSGDDGDIMLLGILSGYLEPSHDMACGRSLAGLWMGWAG